MFAIELDPDIEKRLELLAERTGRTKDFHARAAILEHLANLEDIHLASERLAQPAPTYSADDVKREMGL